MKLSYLASILGAFALPTFLTAAVTVDFNQPLVYSSNFAAVTSTFIQSGDGTVTLSNDSQTAVYQTGFDATSISGETFKLDFLYNGVGTSGGPLMTGITASVTDTYGSSTGTTGANIVIAFRKLLDDSTNVVSIYNDGIEVDSANTGAMVPGQWYRLELDIGGVSGGDFTGVVGRLYSITGGDVLLATLDSAGLPHTITNAALTVDTEVFGFFGGQNPTTRGVEAVDNFVTGGTGVPAINLTATVYDFNGSDTSLTGNFAVNSGAAVWNAAGGQSDSGSVTYGTDSTLVVSNTPFDGGSDGIKVGVFFKTSDLFAAGGGRILSVGFTSDSTDAYDVSSTSTGTDFRVVLARGAHPNYGIQLQNDGTQLVASSANITLTAGSWYYLELSIAGVSGGDYTGVYGQLRNATADGNIGSLLKVIDNSGTGGYTATSALTADTTVYPFFGGQSSTSPIALIDDLTIVVPGTGGTPPTPVLSLAGISGGLLQITCSSESGFNYQLQTSTGLSGFANTGTAQAGTGSDLLFTPAAPASGLKAFYQVEVTAP